MGQITHWRHRCTNRDKGRGRTLGRRASAAIINKPEQHGTSMWAKVMS